MIQALKIMTAVLTACLLTGCAAGKFSYAGETYRTAAKKVRLVSGKWESQSAVFLGKGEISGSYQQSSPDELKSELKAHAGKIGADVLKITFEAIVPEGEMEEEFFTDTEKFDFRTHRGSQRYMLVIKAEFYREKDQ